MKNFMKLSLLIGLIAVLFLSACKKDAPAPTPEPPATNKFEVFKNYLVEQDLDIPNVLDSWITTAESIHGDLASYYVIDIRSAEDFANGHIPGAVNSTLGDVLTAAANSGGKPIIVACYTGQTAGHAVLALRLSGYANAKVLKWGMCSWNDATASSWKSNIGDVADGNPNWKFPAAPATNVQFGDPTLETSKETGAEILVERVAALLSGGMNKISKTDVLAAPGDYFINNFWSAEENTKYGHIDGAYRLNPLTLAGGEYQFLDQSSTIVTYCYTGQTSSMLSAYLKVLGYDVRSLLFGANGMIHGTLESHKWSDAQIMDYELETSLEPYEGFPTLKEYLIANNMDVSQILSGWIITADSLHKNMIDGNADNDFYVIDLRSADDYGTGHIEGAVNSTLANVLSTAADAAGHPIMVACYTGQTAGHAVTALRLSGYTNAAVLKWGMSSWNAATAASWQGNVGDAGIGHANWTAAPGSLATNVDFGDPSFETTAADGAGILAERVQLLLGGGMNKIANADVLASPGDYFINNFWDIDAVEHYGHVSEAYRIKPLTLAGGEYKFLDPDATIVTYCWTGQTSSMVTAYLKVIGYDVKSLLFGTNGMIHSDLETHKWTDEQIKDFPLVN
jgi:rhodanese-related sulfurtransferase